MRKRHTVCLSNHSLDSMVRAIIAQVVVNDVVVVGGNVVSSCITPSKMEGTGGV